MVSTLGLRGTFSDVWEPAATQGSWGGLLPATLESELTAVGWDPRGSTRLSDNVDTDVVSPGCEFSGADSDGP